MRIDLEQFLAIAVGLGAAGAVGIGVYSMRGDTEDAIVEVADQEASAEAAIEPPSSAAVPLPAAPAEPVPEDEALSPVVPDADPLEAYGSPEGSGGGWGGGPDVETPEW